MKLKHINREISHLATMKAKNYISNHGLEQLKEFEYLKSLHEEKVKNLSLSGASQQREQLFRFANDWNNEGWHSEHILESDINRFIEKEPK